LLENVDFTVYIAAILHQIAQVLMVPVMVVLVLLVAYAVFCVGSVVAEIITERRHYRVDMPLTINQLHDASYGNVAAIIEQAALLKPQRYALLMAAGNMGLSEDDLFALAKAEIARVDDRYRRILARSEQVTKVAPMMGLMCTLIPLGPGIVAMGQGDVNQLSMSLLIAFDGTVAGLLAAVVALIATAIRKRWYAQYMTGLESLMTCVLDKAAEARREGKKLPHGVVSGQAPGQAPGTTFGQASVAAPVAVPDATPNPAPDQPFSSASSKRRARKSSKSSDGTGDSSGA
jgi:biopolymer transport protein ExbB/TolQ